jgi:hypothetical protein
VEVLLDADLPGSAAFHIISSRGIQAVHCTEYRQELEASWAYDAEEKN